MLMGGGATAAAGREGSAAMLGDWLIAAQEHGTGVSTQEADIARPFGRPTPFCVSSQKGDEPAASAAISNQPERGASRDGTAARARR
jgi:hypothetical protein